MRYDAPLSFSIGSLTSVEALVLAAILPIAIGLMVGLNRETAVIAGVLAALTMIAIR
ncbi:MAG: hypothetical protein AAFR17_14495 [Pseudomonadota bacterium]